MILLRPLARFVQNTPSRAFAAALRCAAVAALLPLLAVPAQYVSAETLMPAPGQQLTITILDGEGALNNIRVRDAREPIIQVTDANHKPVAGASVVFLLHGGASGAGGSFLPAATGTVTSATAAQTSVGFTATSASTAGGAAGSTGAAGAGAGTAGAGGQVTVSTDASVFQGASPGGDQAFVTKTDSEGKARSQLKPNALTGAFIIGVIVLSEQGSAATYIHMENVRSAVAAKPGGKFHTLTHGAPLVGVITVTAIIVTAVLVTTNSGGSAAEGSGTTITTGPGGVTTPGLRPAGHGLTFSFGRK